MFQPTGLPLATFLTCSTSESNVHHAVPPILFSRLAQAGPRFSRAGDHDACLFDVGHGPFPVAAGLSPAKRNPAPLVRQLNKDAHEYERSRTAR